MHEVTTFQYQSHQFRSLIINDEPWFVAKDVCDVLEIVNNREAISSLDEEDLASELLTSGGQRREMRLVSEPGLYQLIFKSRTDAAKKFKRWVTHEVLPTIRKTGSYTMDACPADKTVDIRHFRNTPSPSGLDIRYTLDLTKVVMKPTALTLGLVSRLTGVDLSDLAFDLEAREAGNSAVVELFVQDCCIIDPDARLTAADLYGVYCKWQQDWDNSAPMSRRAFGSCVGARFTRIKTGGTITYLGLTFNGEVRV